MPPSLQLRYVDAREFPPHGTQAERVLGVVGFGAPRPSGLSLKCPFAPIAIPPLDTQPVYEVWSSADAVRYEERLGVACGHTDDVLFGSLQLPEEPGGSLDDLAQDAYNRLFETVDGAGYGNILRVWNYFPAITRDDEAIQRYHRFSRGRFEAFAVRNKAVETAPAASAIGSSRGPVTIVFLASRGTARPIENPRQVSAYRYPPKYGSRSPTFSRAILSDIGRLMLFVSGTASVVGHESLHAGDPEAQVRETIANLRAVFAEAVKAGLEPSSHTVALKVYIRHPEHLTVIRERVEEFLKARGTANYLHAEICRPELLLEIEGVVESWAGL